MSSIIDFITRWKASGGSEQANSQLFLSELCAVLDLPTPDPARPVNEENLYSFERKVYVQRGDGTEELKRLDFYRKGCFVMESKQGQDRETPLILSGMTTSAAVKRGGRQWEDAMQRAKRQAENYIRCLPSGEGRPPFLIVADVGYCFDIYAEFSCTGGLYLPFPDARNCRVMLDDLEKPEVRAMFQAIWNAPLSLDPSRRAAKVTEEVATHLATLARLLEADGHEPEKVSQFLMRCIFSMFAEDVNLIPKGGFSDILQKSINEPEAYEILVKDLWTAMNDGAYSLVLCKKLLRFNGNLFADPEVLPLTREQIKILLEAARADWKEVEPAIFGTLLERALNPKERHKLGAHYTPRAYVERLVVPTVVQPLREEWDNVQAAASLLFLQGKEKQAHNLIKNFHDYLRHVKVLDPACGSGNFLYVSMEHMKRLEGEVLQTLMGYVKISQLHQINPEQFLGLEINPRAAHIADMVLWIGFLQWHFRTYGNIAPPEPIINKYDNIQHRDALIDHRNLKPARDDKGEPITRWDGETYKTDTTTGRQARDETAVIVDELNEAVSAAKWPEADFIVGNPPFIGNKRMRQTLGSGYSEALRATYGSLPESCDFVMYWWHKAAELARAGKVKRFGFITTNSITQVFNRRVVALHLEDRKPLRLVFAVPDHPWVDASDGAAVRIAMTVGGNEDIHGRLNTVIDEQAGDKLERDVTFHERQGAINADLSIGANIVTAKPLLANADLSCKGVTTLGKGFIIPPDEAVTLGLGRIPGIEKHIRHYRNGKDITSKPRGVMVIDLFGLSVDEVRERFPDIYQWILTRVKPEREAKASNSKDYREYASKWWIFAKPRETFRPALAGIPRFIATSETAKHRFFVFLSTDILPDIKLVNIASADAFHLGVLSSRIHVCWSLAVGGRLGVGNDPVYVKTNCFDAFPFPDATPEQQASIRDLGEKLDAHRKARQELYPDLTMTGMYNVMESLRSGRELTEKEKTIHEQGLVTVLRELHDELDAAVAEAYGWPVDIANEEILSRLVALNAERAEEEKNGQIRWLRPEYQTKSKEERKSESFDFVPLDEPTDKRKRTKSSNMKSISKTAWPTDVLGQLQVVRNVLDVLRNTGVSITPDAVAERFARAPRAKVQEILQALETLGLT